MFPIIEKRIKLITQKGRLKIARCPECAGLCKWQSSIKRMVCQSCGLSLTRYELENYWVKIKKSNFLETDELQKKKNRRKEWLDWYSQSKAEKEKY